jgi:uncharacterized protein HemX
MRIGTECLQVYIRKKSENVAIKKSVSEWKQTLKKYTEYCMNKILKIMQQIKHGT